MADLKGITKPRSPRSDVQGGLTDAQFAAQLDRIVRDPTRTLVRRPESFFAVNYPAQGRGMASSGPKRALVAGRPTASSLRTTSPRAHGPATFVGY
jgi:hypothetical protein